MSVLRTKVQHRQPWFWWALTNIRTFYVLVFGDSW